MATKAPGAALLSAKADLSRFPDYKGLSDTTTDPNLIGYRNKSKTVSAQLNGDILAALVGYCNDTFAIVKIADGDYASEVKCPDGTFILAQAVGQRLFACSYDPRTGAATALPHTDSFDVSSILALFICIEADTTKMQNISENENPISWDLLMDAKHNFASKGMPIPEYAIRIVNDNLYFGLTYGGIKTTVRGGAIDLLKAERINGKEFDTAVTICGKPEILGQKSAVTKTRGMVTVADAKAMAADYVATLNWSEKERELIPVFPDDTEVPEEVVKILDRFLKSRDWAIPMNNPCWRGTTGFGKSTGVKILACILNTPVVVMTCSTTTETEDFLSKHVPVGKSKGKGKAKKLSKVMSKLTTDDCRFDPAYAFKQITGEEKEDATAEEALEAYAKAAKFLSKKGKNENSPFKLVKSDFLKGLKRGYIVEVAEYSRIRNSGVLVGLNNFSDPGAVITLADGTHIRRHPNAMVVWTDNIGLESCHNVDASVLRRMSYIIDSQEMSADRVIRRIKANTHVDDIVFLKALYNVWTKIAAYAKENDITDEGQVSIVELENWVRLTMLDGKEQIRKTLHEAIVSKLSSDPDTQAEIMDKCCEPALSKEKLIDN